MLAGARGAPCAGGTVRLAIMAAAVVAALPALPSLAALPPLPEPSAAERELVGVRFLLKSARVEGARSLPPESVDGVVSQYAGRDVGTGDLREIAARLTALYTDRGYATSGVVLKSSSPGTGEAVFEAIEGPVTHVRLVAPPKVANPAWLTRQLVPDPTAPARLPEIQERMAALRDAGVVDRINASLEPLPKQGESELVVYVEEPRPWSLTLEYDNYHSPVVGARRPSLGFSHRNVTGWGDRLDLHVGKTSGLEDVNVSWFGAIPTTRLLAGLRFERSDSLAIDPPSFRALDIKTLSETQGADLGWKFLTPPSLDLQARLAFDKRKSDTTLLGLPFSFIAGLPDGRARADVWRGSFLGTRKGEADVAFGRIQFSRGEVTSPLEETDFAPAGKFNALFVQAQYARRLTEGGILGTVRLEGQYTKDRLLPIEKYALGGHSTVRGYRENLLLRDRGALVSAEVRMPFWRWDDKGRLDVAVFAEGAYSDNSPGSVPDALPSRIFSGGLSLIALGPYGLGARVDLAYPSRRWLTDNADTQDRGLHFQVTWSADRVVP
jgi:hemolysin activation/secretion protein